MKSSLIPQVRVAPKLRADAEAVLREGESLSEFVEESVRRAVELRQIQSDFHARGEAALQHYMATKETYAVSDVLSELKAMTAAKRESLNS